VNPGQRDHITKGGHEDVRKVIKDVEHHPAVVGLMQLGYLQFIDIIVVNLSELDIATDSGGAAFVFSRGGVGLGSANSERDNKIRGPLKNEVPFKIFA